MQQSIDPAREKRNSVIVRALVEAPGGAAVERRVRNLSRSGACVEHAGELRDGITDRLAGLRFADTIDLEEARKPRGVGVRPRAGWIAEINDAYRR